MSYASLPLNYFGNPLQVKKVEESTETNPSLDGQLESEMAFESHGLFLEGSNMRSVD